MIPDSSVSVHSVTMQPGVLNIQYSEERESNEYVVVARSVVIDAEQIEEEYTELEELLRDIIDKALLILRNPPKTIRKRTREREEEEDYDDEESGSTTVSESL